MPIFTTLGAACAKAWGFTSGLITDQYFNLVSLLLPGNGTNGAQNNTFLDGSSNNFTITRNGNTTQGTFSPFSQTGWGNYFNGSSSILETSTSIFGTWSTANASTTTATIEAMVYVNVLQSAPANAYQNPSIITKGNTYLNFSVNSTGNIVFFHYDGSFRYITSSGTIQANTWNYVAVTITGGTATIYINGTSSGSGTWYGIQTGGLVAPTYIGQTPTGQYWNGYISNLRVSSTVRTIATPLAPYTNDGNTSLLTCQSNRFRDASTNGYTITATGSPSVTPFSPFAPTQPYSAAAVGGSGYFDGTGDYLTAPGNTAFDLGSGDFTIEAWIYKQGSGQKRFIDYANGTATNANFSFAMLVTSSNVAYGEVIIGSTVYGITGTTTVINTWTHVALVRNGTASGNLKLYVNGVAEGTAASLGSTAINTLTGTPYLSISSYYNGVGEFFNGYVSSARIIKGTALYTGNFTPSTAPFTAVSGTSLLLNFTNAGITDATAKNDLETVGNAQISTTQSKWGGGSILFDGTDDRLTNNNAANPLYAFRTGDFTIEAWVYPTVNTGERGWFQTSDTVGGLKTSYTTGVCMFTSPTPNAYWLVQVGSTAISTTTSVQTNTWTHVAITRTNGSVRVYIGGTLAAGPTSATADLTGQYLVVGGYYSTAYLFNGYIDDLRITNYSRYSGASLTVPTAPFPVQ